METQKRYKNAKPRPPRPSTLLKKLQKNEAVQKVRIAHHNPLRQTCRNVGSLGTEQVSSLLLPLLCRHWPRARTTTTFIGSSNRSDATGQWDVRSSLLLEAWFKDLPSGWSSIHSSTLISSGAPMKKNAANAYLTLFIQAFPQFPVLPTFT
jgi:hypothetical protein